jgi:hypothetical protein
MILKNQEDHSSQTIDITEAINLNNNDPSVDHLTKGFSRKTPTRSRSKLHISSHSIVITDDT